MKKHKISHPCRNCQENTEKILFFYFYLLLFLCPLVAQEEDVEPIPQEGIVEVPSPDPISNEAICIYKVKYTYQGTLSWQGNQASAKFNYHFKKEKR